MLLKYFVWKRLLLTFNILFTKTVSSSLITVVPIIYRTKFRTITVLTSSWWKFIKTFRTSVAFLSYDSRMTLTFSIRIALETSWPDQMAVTRYTVTIFSHKVIISTSLAIWSISVSTTVQAMTTMTCCIVQLLIKEATVGETVAVTFWKNVQTFYLIVTNLCFLINKNTKYYFITKSLTANHYQKFVLYMCLF